MSKSKDELDRLAVEVSEFSSHALASASYLQTGIKTPVDLIGYLAYVLGVVIPNRHNCEDPTHSAPFDFISKVFFGEVEDALLRANRSGGKSFDAGLVTFLRHNFPPSSTRILGGSLDQSEKSYEAFAEFWHASGSADEFLKAGVLKERTDHKSGARVEILTASKNSVRGPHQPNLILDEVEEMKKEIFEAALSQPQSKGIARASTLILSTYHRTDGIMSELIDEYQERGYTYFAWCIMEVVESCRDYSCSRCPISSFCPGKHMKQATGYYLIGDVNKKMHQLDQETFDTEWLCKDPTKRHLVYSVFEKKHIVDCPFNPLLPFGLSVDWGGIDPFVVLVWQKHPDLGDVVVSEVYLPNADNRYLISICKSEKWWDHISRTPADCDPARHDLIREWRKEGVLARGVSSRLDDISLVRTKLAPMLGEPSLYVHKDCRHTISEFSKGYRQNKDGKPIDKDNHCMDCVRYYVRANKTKTSSKPGIKTRGGQLQTGRTGQTRIRTSASYRGLPGGWK